MVPFVLVSERARVCVCMVWIISRVRASCVSRTSSGMGWESGGCTVGFEVRRTWVARVQHSWLA